jgi:hypothetical protein
VVKEGARLEDEIVNPAVPKGGSDQADLRRPEGRGEGELAEVEAEGGGDVEVGVDVVDVVEAPQQGNPVVGPGTPGIFSIASTSV